MVSRWAAHRVGADPAQDTSSLIQPQAKSYGKEEEEGNPGTAVPARTPAAAVLLLGVQSCRERTHGDSQLVVGWCQEGQSPSHCSHHPQP